MARRSARVPVALRRPTPSAAHRIPPLGRAHATDWLGTANHKPQRTIGVISEGSDWSKSTTSPTLRTMARSSAAGAFGDWTGWSCRTCVTGRAALRRSPAKPVGAHLPY